MNRTGLWILLLVLVALHHDFWFWNNPDLVGGWLPIGLAWHLGLSVAAVVFWSIVVLVAWPHDSDMSSRDTDGSEVTQ